jgi:hypothetical protein
MPTLEADKIVSAVTTTLKDAMYVSVGAGVLIVQRAQVRRQELRRHFADQVETGRDRLGGITKTVEAGVASIERRVDVVLDDVQARLPSQAAEMLTTARNAARKLIAAAVPS